MNSMMEKISDTFSETFSGNGTTEKEARGLGVASLAIGLTELAAPRQLERLMGIPDGENTTVMRMMGLREVMHGVDILAHDDPTESVWRRVAGDVVDTALLGVAARKTKRPAMFAAVTATVLAIGALDLMCAMKLKKGH
jgi:hypothetical protein